jgi:polyisoprenoid-binding protein YceI
MRYRLDASHGKFNVQAFAEGMLSVFGHSPTFAVRDFHGIVTLDERGPGGMTIEMVVRADSLALIDRVSASDRREIEDRMRREVLETHRYAEIRHELRAASATAAEPGKYLVRLDGSLSLHGVTRPHAVDAELRLHTDAFELRGACPLRMSEYQIKPVRALAGAIRLKDELSVSFELLGLPEEV